MANDDDYESVPLRAVGHIVGRFVPVERIQAEHKRMVNDNRDDSTDPHPPRQDYFEPFPLIQPVDMPAPLEYAGRQVEMQRDLCRQLEHRVAELERGNAVLLADNERLASDLQQAQEDVTSLRIRIAGDHTTELILGGPTGQNQEEI